MSAATVTSSLLAQRIIPVLRLDSAELTSAAVKCLHGAGFRVFEITMTTSGAPNLISQLAVDYPDSLIGAGTVLDERSARDCLERGARFLVSPCIVPELVELAHAAGAAALPGGFTPSEVLAAIRAGADIVKIFPASSGGPAHLAALRAIFPQTAFCPTGGVSAENAATYFAAGAAVVGIGNNIIDRASLVRGDHAAVIGSARKLLNAATQWSKQ